MSKKLSANEFEEQDGWIARLRDRWFGDGDEEDEESPTFNAGATNGQAAARPRRNASTLLQVHQHRGGQISKRMPKKFRMCVPTMKEAMSRIKLLTATWRARARRAEVG